MSIDSLNRRSLYHVPAGSLAMIAALALAVALASSTTDRIACGIHTVRADDAALSLVHRSGCTWVLQLFSWSELEPLPGEYFWEYADSVVRACEHYGLKLVVRLDQPPAWALSSTADGPPVDPEAYGDFVDRVVQRYRGRISAYVIWNEPNLAQEWGGLPPDPEGYVRLLEAAYTAVKRNDPQALVVSAGLAPTNAVDDSALDDRTYLRSMYERGASDYFDVLGAHPYGFAYPPDDPRGTHGGLNFLRLMDLREIMVEKGDQRKPVWATEVGWTTTAADVSQQWLVVSESQQAFYLRGVFDQAAERMPWLEAIFVWNLTADLPADDEKRGYSIVDDAYSPKPAYLALAQMPKAIGALAGPHRDQRLHTVEVLAPDVAIRLGDVDTLHPHWTRIHGGLAPSRRWKGDFFVDSLDGSEWVLVMEIMQVEEHGNTVCINGQPLAPMAIPLRGKTDFASNWTTTSLTIPAGVLVQGRNVLEIRASPRLPVYQDAHARYESLQFRNVSLVRAS